VDALILICRLVLAVVFAVAAVAKLTDRADTRRAVVDFGVREPVAAWLAIGLPIAELAVAVLLLPASTAPAGALGALLLLLLFSAAILFNLAHGREPECHCFGQLHSAPAGPRTLARNGLLAVVAALTLAGTVLADDPGAVAWVEHLDGAETAVVAIGAATALLAIAGATAFVSLLRSYGRVLVRLERMEQTLAAAGLTVEPRAQVAVHGLEPGTPAPGFAGLDELLALRLPALLLFVSPDCGPCRALLPEVARWQTEHADRLTVAIASAGKPGGEVRPEAAELGLSRVFLDEELELYRAFEANGTPSAVLIAPDGSIASHVASGQERIEALVAGVLDARGLPIGAPIPELELPSLDGERVNLAELRGHETLLLFWNPDCGHCRAMHDELLTREADANGSSPRLVIVSSADEAKIRADGFTSTVLLDEDFEAGDEFGIRGTPMAVVLAADGRIASGVAAGAKAILALAEPRDNAEVLALPETREPTRPR
jgi:thiol-disulfide isomerase/thioredoxin